MIACPHIDQALRDGCRLHGFRSGGGLRVIRVERGGEHGKRGPDLIGYGEHPHAEAALRHAEADVKAGGRPYKEVYGGEQPHYVTGSSSASSRLDEVLLSGGDFDAWAEVDGTIVATTERTRQQDFPKDLITEVEHSRQTARFEARGYIFDLVPADVGVWIKVASCPEGGSERAATWYEEVRTGRGATLAEAMAALDTAEPSA